MTHSGLRKSKSPSHDKKDVPLNLRVAAAEKATFARAAEIAGVPLSAWIRERLRIAALRELDNIGEAAQFLTVPSSTG
jgi:uncharacterized protein (DUF1778 family)